MRRVFACVVGRAGLGLLLVAAATLGCGRGRESGPTTADEVALDGSTVLVWGSGPSGVVLAHGASYDAASWEDQARVLADQGVAVAAVEDLSAEAVTDAAAFLRDERRAERVTLLGSSAGAAPVIEAAAADPTVADGLVLLSPAGGDLGAVSGVPTLVIYSEDESLADGIASMVEAAPGADVRTEVVPGDRHGQGVFTGDQADMVLDTIAADVRQPAGRSMSRQEQGAALRAVPALDDAAPEDADRPGR